MMTMNKTSVKRAYKLQGALSLPGDKSISHRAALIALVCRQKVEITNFAPGDDCQRSLAAVRQLGGVIETEANLVRISMPPDGLLSPTEPINCGNSGTTMRLLAGLLCGSGVSTRLVGDQSLSRRPMDRIAAPLRLMNANIELADGDTAPMKITPSRIIPIDYTLPVASAQVKSSLLFAGLASGCDVTIRERIVTRDHMERMIRHMGGTVNIEDVVPELVTDPKDPRKRIKITPTDEYKRTITLAPAGRLSGGVIEIPGDISTAAYFIAAALMVPGSHLILQGVGLNSTRTMFINILKQMGADIKISGRLDKSGEPTGDIEVKYTKLKPRKIAGDIIPGLIDELPILAVLAASLAGTTVIRDAAELRLKESDRIKALTVNLNAMGVKVGEFPDGLAIEGSGEINGAEVDSFGDHRVAMAFAVAGLAAHGTTVIKNSDVVKVSCPSFFTMLEGLRVK